MARQETHTIPPPQTMENNHLHPLIKVPQRIHDQENLSGEPGLFVDACWDLSPAELTICSCVTWSTERERVACAKLEEIPHKA